MKQLAFGALFAFPSMALGAQQTGAQPTPTVTISGTVYDSLAHRPLAGADVMLGGNAPPLSTDSLGHFAATGLTPGVYQVGVFHPRLDTLDLALGSAPFSAVAGNPNNVDLAIPSVATLIGKRCGRPARENEALISGRVESVEKMHALAGVDVSLAWTEVTLPLGGAPSVAPREVHVTTDSSGRYTFCGVPGDLKGNLQARHDLVSVAIPITLAVGSLPIVTRNFFLVTETATSGQRGRATGVVSQAAGNGALVEGARVEVAGTDVVTQTDQRGVFALNNIPLGTQVVVIRKVGFTSQAIPVDVLPNQQPRLTVSLANFVSYLDPVVVTARVDHALKSVGFVDRKRQGLGQYITAADIDRHKYTYMTDIIRSRVPGIRLDRTSAGPILRAPRSSIVRGAACVHYFVDDVRWTSISEGDINAINPAEVAGVEFYQGNATPIQYGTVDDCTTVVIWTKTRVGM
jgi:hypothetical protein